MATATPNLSQAGCFCSSGTSRACKTTLLTCLGPMPSRAQCHRVPNVITCPMPSRAQCHRAHHRCMILIASYTANLAQSLLLANAKKVRLSAESFQDLRDRRQTVCTRSGTAVTAVVEELMPTEQVFKVSTDGGLRAQQGSAAQHIRSSMCAGFVQPLWMTQDMLATEPNANCDLRITYPSIEAGQGGYITASEWFRRHALTNALGPALAAGANLTTLAGGGACSSVATDAIGALLKSSRHLRSFRTSQLERLRTNQCGMNGAPLGDTLASAVDTQLTPKHFIGLILVLFANVCLALLLSPPCRMAFGRLAAACRAALPRSRESEVVPVGEVERLRHAIAAIEADKAELKEQRVRETIRAYNDRDLRDFAIRAHQQHADLKKSVQQLRSRVDLHTRMLEEILSKLGGPSSHLNNKNATKLQRAVRRFLAHRSSSVNKLQNEALHRLVMLNEAS